MCGSESILKMLADGLTANAGVREKKPRKARPKEGHTDVFIIDYATHDTEKILKYLEKRGA